MAAWTNALQVYVFDVIEEGADAVIAGAKLAGAETIVLLVSCDEDANVATVHNPHRQTNWGEAFFPPTASRYPRGLVPSVSSAPQSDGKAGYDALRAAGDRSGINVVPWLHLMRTPAGSDDRNLAVNIRGEYVREWLCPNGPDTIAFAGGMAVDAVEQFQPSAVFADRIRFQALGSHGLGGPGSFDNVSVCFCDGCFGRAKSEGVDLEKARRLLIGWVGLLEKEPSAVAELALDAVSSAVGGARAASEWPEILSWLQFRHRTINRLVERVRRSIRDETELWLDVWPATDAWLLGQDLRALAPFATWVKPFFYHQWAAGHVGKLIQSLSADARTQQTFYDVYLRLFGRQGPQELGQFIERGLDPEAITSEMRLAKKMLGTHSKLAAGVGLWGIGADGVREILTAAAAAEPAGVWMHCYAWATMDELAAAGEWLREHGKAAPVAV